jgi:ferredoxin
MSGRRPDTAARVSLPIFTPPPAPAARGVDLLRLRFVGPLLRARRSRVRLQIALLAVAAAVVAHGWFGPQLAPKNIATVAIWVHFRGLLMLALIAIGNVFCGGCPLILVRDVARRWRAPTAAWPRWLRGKWLAVALLVAVLFSYELWDLWARPAATAWLVVGYFAAALAVDLTFKGASFCKHVCPIGQFNFVASTLSPFELRVKDAATCGGCATRDCIKGRATPTPAARPAQRGCELGLFLPRKEGNLDCTMCLDCVRACPHDNIALAPRAPAAELAHDGARAGIGRLHRRRDLAALAAVFTFAAVLNAFGMVGAAARAERWLARVLGVATEAPVLASLFVVALVVAPVVLLGLAALVSRALAGRAARDHAREAARYSHALVPLGVGIWAAHYGFHLLTGALTIVPVTQSAAVDLFGRALLGAPRWTWAGLRPGALFPIEAGLVLVGALGSIAVARQIAERDHPDRALRAAAPWFVVVAVMAALALWVLAQPMEMRAVALGG